MPHRAGLQEFRIMDPTALVSGFIGARLGEMQLAVTARMLKMDADNGAAVAKLVDAAQHSLDGLAAAASGLGANLDIRV